ncbi:MAG: DUF6647 family protein [Bdellovibrionales bacterium]
MKTLLLTLIVSLLTLGFPQQAKADFEDGDVVPTSVVAPLMAWVEVQTGVRVPALPRVIASHSRLAQVVSHMGRISGRARALYVGGMVVLDHRSFDMEDDVQVSLLVHELVHYAQTFKPRDTWACSKGKEVEAYTLQNQWLEEHGHGPFVRTSWINRMAACPASPASAMAVASAN